MLPFAERPDPEPESGALVSAGRFGQLRLWSLSTVCVRVVFLRKGKMSGSGDFRLPASVQCFVAIPVVCVAGVDAFGS